DRQAQEALERLRIARALADAELSGPGVDVVRRVVRLPVAVGQGAGEDHHRGEPRRPDGDLGRAAPREEVVALVSSLELRLLERAGEAPSVGQGREDDRALVGGVLADV